MTKDQLSVLIDAECQKINSFMFLEPVDSKVPVTKSELFEIIELCRATINYLENQT